MTSFLGGLLGSPSEHPRAGGHRLNLGSLIAFDGGRTVSLEQSESYTFWQESATLTESPRDVNR